MTTEDQAPVRCEHEMKYGRCELEAGHRSEHSYTIKGQFVRVPAPEETVETTEECPHRFSAFWGCVYHKGHTDPHKTPLGREWVTGSFWDRTEPPAPEPAGEAEDRCEDCEILSAEHDTGFALCDRHAAEFDSPAPSSGTPGLTEAQRIYGTYHLTGRYKLGSHWRSDKNNDAFVPAPVEDVIRAEARRPLEQALREIQALDMPELENYEAAFWAAYAIAERALGTVGGADDAD